MTTHGADRSIGLVRHPPQQQPSPAIKSTRHPLQQWLKLALFLALGATLVWLVATKSLVAYLAKVAPQAALSLHANDAVALLELAEQRLAEMKSGPNPAQTDQGGATETHAQSSPSGNVDKASEQIRAIVKQALRSDPHNARALRILGQLTATASNEDSAATQLMQAAARLSLRESIALAWLMQRSYERKEYELALRWADALLRTRPQLARHIVPMLARIAENERARPALETLLAGNPPWRPQFFAMLPANVKDARTPLHLLLSLKKTQTPPTSTDLRSYLHFLISRKFYDLAYYTWLQFLTPKQLRVAGFLFNGSFEGGPSGLPFDWVLTTGPGVTMDIAAPPDRDGGRALYVAFGHGRVRFRGIAQLTMLPPGRYRLDGRYKGEIRGLRGLRWRITCAESHSRLGESPMFVGPAPTWQSFYTTFTVPPSNCRAQYLQLIHDARSASEQLITGSVWYDDLTIERVSRAD